MTLASLPAPAKKHPGWTVQALSEEHLGVSHRAPAHKARIADAIRRSARLLSLPEDWKLGIVLGSDTGAFEMAMWSLLGPLGVDVLVWESFSSDWATDIEQQLKLQDVRFLRADYGRLPDLSLVSPKRDVVFVYNGTTSGTRVSNLDWIDANRSGLVVCDATSAAFAMPLDFSKLDVVTWSWQKVLGGEAGFGMLAISPRTVERLETYTPPWPLPKIFRLTKNGELNAGIFKGATINTPSMLAIEDLHSALDWASNIGGLAALHARTGSNFETVDSWVEQSDWIDWLSVDPATRSSTSMCLSIVDPAFKKLDESQQSVAVKTMASWLAEEGIAFDITSYRAAPPGFRIWGGGTVNTSDIEALLPWLDWAFARWKRTHSGHG